MGVAWWLDPPPGQETLEQRNLPRGTFKARYNSGTCADCHSMVLRGEVVRYRKRHNTRQLVHFTCPQGGKRVRGDDRQERIPGMNDPLP